MPDTNLSAVLFKDPATTYDEVDSILCRWQGSALQEV